MVGLDHGVDLHAGKAELAGPVQRGPARGSAHASPAGIAGSPGLRVAAAPLAGLKNLFSQRLGCRRGGHRLLTLTRYKGAMCDAGNRCARRKGARPQGARAGSVVAAGRGWRRGRRTFRGRDWRTGRRTIWGGGTRCAPCSRWRLTAPSMGPPSIPATVAIRHKPVLRTFYQRLVAAGKARKLALVAAMRKLLVASGTAAVARSAISAKSQDSRRARKLPVEGPPRNSLQAADVPPSRAWDLPLTAPRKRAMQQPSASI